MPRLWYGAYRRTTRPAILGKVDRLGERSDAIFREASDRELAAGLGDLAPRGMER